MLVWLVTVPVHFYDGRTHNDAAHGLMQPTKDYIKKFLATRKVYRLQGLLQEMQLQGLRENCPAEKMVASYDANLKQRDDQ